jgi:hypothetical protein
MRMKICLALTLILALAGCSGVRQFAAGDLANAGALAKGGNDPLAAACWVGLAAAAAPTPDPADDGAAVLAERKRLIVQAVGAGPCAAVVAPMLLQDIGKAIPAPFNLALPF